MRDSLVAINILKENTIINERGVPFLYYWDGESNVIESIKNDIKFISYLYEKIANKSNYALSRLTMFYFKYDDNNNENYTEEQIQIQSFLTLDMISEDKRMFYKEYLWEHFKYLYSSAYHEEYDKEVSLFDIDEAILDVYDKIQKKYPKKVIKSTVVNYIRGELQKQDNLSLENTEWVISQLENILNEKE